MLNNAICTSCGANVKVDPTKEAAVCEYCGAAFVVEKAINNYNIDNAQISAGIVNVSVGTSSEKLKASAEKSLSAGQYRNAYLDFRKAIENDMNDYEAYWGVVRVHKAQFPRIDVGWHYFEAKDIIQKYSNLFSSGLKAIHPYYEFWCISADIVTGMARIPDYIFIGNATQLAVDYAPEEKAREYSTLIKSDFGDKSEKDMFDEKIQAIRTYYLIENENYTSYICSSNFEQIFHIHEIEQCYLKAINDLDNDIRSGNKKSVPELTLVSSENWTLARDTLKKEMKETIEKLERLKNQAESANTEKAAKSRYVIGCAIVIIILVLLFFFS